MSGDWDAYADFYATGPYAPHLTEMRVGGSAPITIMEAAQPAGDFSDPAFPELVITEARSELVHGSVDLGGGRFEANFPKGNFVIIPPKTATTILLDQPHSVRLFAIPESYLEPLLFDVRPEDALFDFGALNKRSFTSEKLRNLSGALWAAAANQLPTSRLAVDGALLSILSEIYAIADQQVTYAQGGLAPWQLRWVTEHMQAHLGDDVSLSCLAALVGLSPNHFCTAFKASTGEPPHRHFIRLRIECSKQMLEQRQLTITDIALNLGFGSSAHFSTVFRKHTAMTPTQWRRERVFATSIKANLS